ncbi:MAG: YceI family protein [Candidatus Hydrogenedentales bacterium]
MNRLPLNTLTSLLLLAALLPACSEGPGDAPTATISEAQPDAVDVGANPPSPQEAQPGGAGVPTVYALTDETFIGFTGYKIGGKHFGQINAYDGSVTVPGDDLTQTQIKLEMDMTSAKTDDSILSNTLQNENFFNTEQHPTATFESTQITRTNDNYEVTGNFTLRGVAKGITFPAEIAVEDDTLTARAEFTVNRKEWQVGQGWKEDAIIKDDVLIELDVVAKAAEGAAGELVDQFSQPAEGSRPKEQ